MKNQQALHHSQNHQLFFPIIISMSWMNRFPPALRNRLSVQCEVRWPRRMQKGHIPPPLPGCGRLIRMLGGEEIGEENIPPKEACMERTRESCASNQH